MSKKKRLLRKRLIVALVIASYLVAKIYVETTQNPRYDNVPDELLVVIGDEV